MKFSSLALSTVISFAVFNHRSPTRVCVCAKESNDLLGPVDLPFLDDNETPVNSIRGLEVDIFEDLRESADEIYGGGIDESIESGDGHDEGDTEGGGGYGGHGPETDGGTGAKWHQPDQETITKTIVNEIKMELTGHSSNDEFVAEQAILNAIRKLFAGATAEQMRSFDEAWFQKHIYVSQWR